MAASELRSDEVEGLLDGLDAFELGLVDGDVERLLEGHHQFDQVEAVGLEVVAEAGIRGDLLGRYLQHVDGAGLELLEGGFVVHLLILLYWLTTCPFAAMDGRRYQLPIPSPPSTGRVTPV